jgi:hypothetical protein
MGVIGNKKAALTSGLLTLWFQRLCQLNRLISNTAQPFVMLYWVVFRVLHDLLHQGPEHVGNR